MSDYRIELGIGLKTDDLADIKKKINSLEDNPIKLKVDAETKELTSTIREALNSLSKGTKNSLTLDTSGLEGSITDIRNAVVDLKKVFGSLDDSTNFKSLLASVNQIATALGKVTDESETLVKSLSILSKKEFGFNFNLKTGNANPIKAATDYGIEARRKAIPALQEQAAHLQNLLGGYQQADKALERYLVKIHKSSGVSIKNNLIDDMSNTGSIAKQMEAIEKYIDYLKKIATTKGIDLSSFDAQFSKSAEKIVDDTVKIQTGAKQTEEALEEVGKEMKQIFGGGVSAEALSASLQPIISDLGEIKKVIQSLSSNNSINGLTQSFNRLSETLEKLVSNLTLAKNTLDTGFSNTAPANNVVRTAQQTGQKIGETISKSAKQSINLDDVIDKQVLKLMDEYAIAGGKGSKAFDEIRQSLVNFRDGSGDINKVTSAISNNMRVVNEAKDDYKDLAEYIKMFNASGAKVHIPDSIKQEYGDDYKSMRSQLGKGFTSGKGMDFETFVVELNSILGETIDLSHGAEAAFGDLVRKVNSTKGGKFLTGDDLFRSGILDMGDVVANVSTSLEQIENAEEQIAQSSTAATNVVVQNEERKQQAIKQTVDAYSGITAVADNAEDVVTTMGKALRDLGVKFSGADVITRDIQEMGVEVQKVVTRINGNNLEVSISGMQSAEDGIKRVVTATKKYADAIENTENINKMFVQSFETSAEAAKRLEKETTASFKKLKSIAKEMGDIDIKIAGLEASGDIDGASSLKRVLNDLESEFRELYSVTEKNLSADQFRELEQIFANTTGEVREFNTELARSTEAKELTSGLERLKSITKEIATLKIDIFKFEDIDNIERASNRLNELEAEASELRVELQRKFNITSFDEIDDIARKGEEALSRLVDKVAEARVQLAKDIKLKITSGGFDDDLFKVDERFKKLSAASTDLRNSIDKVKTALSEMEAAAGGDGEKIVDVERLIQAQKDYAEALEKTNNLLRMQERLDKADNERLKLDDDIKLFQSDIDSWLTKNSAAAEKFGAELLELKAKAESCDRIELNHLRKQFKLLDKEAEKAGLKMQSFGDRIKTKLKEYSAYFSVAEVFMYVTQGLKDMFDQVVAIDTAMTELKKVTNETDSSYNQFLSNAASRAKELGITIDGLVASAADFARLGFEFGDVQGLAEVANIYSVVGDDIDSVETATQSLISTMTAFKDEMNGLSDSDFALNIVDKFNEVSNNFAISSGGIGEALQRSASSMAAANNSLDETIALITAANTVVQDADSVGTAFKTKNLIVFMYRNVHSCTHLKPVKPKALSLQCG